ncbi:hypothetical protein D9758_000913 [Tetrapyrgos nigripes]|uniref:Zn(2)-C6 fungal-type domain-containing protein n=1 Tax=Tetrapyrgos nigripes TaxID=182062 RepID=A0A8H5GZT1_9AGAR|nr:hypothetical protein D9758_000913 [Tetrapyrgos nigripes]
MPVATYSYSSYYHASPTTHQYSPHYLELHSPISPNDYFPQDYMSPQDQSGSMPPPSPSIPIDPALAMQYPPYYQSYAQSSHMPPPLSMPPSYSSPSSQASDTISTPPADFVYPSPNGNGKRPASAISSSSNDARKRSRKDDDPRSPTAEKEEKPKPTRGSRACTVCRRLKMKCIGAEQGPPCKRCQTGNHECIFEESNRGKRSSKKHELLTRSLRKMERTLDTVLRSIGNPSIASGMISRSPSPNGTAQSSTTQALLARSPTPPPSGELYHGGSPKLHSLPDNSLNPLGLLAEASLANRRAQGNNPSAMTHINPAGNKIGVASDNYFKPGPMTILPLRRLYIERQVQPEMLSFVSTSDVVALFNIYFDHMNIHSNLLDRTFHTPSLVCSRSPFLLTTICAIASKFYVEKPELHSRLAELSKKLAFGVPAAGYKSVEIVQAYLLLTLWGCGAVERYEQDKTWLLLGMAIRMATDLNLHRKTAVTSSHTQEGRARDIEVHNRERTWMLCFCLDRSHSAQLGKPYTVKEDAIIRDAHTWCKKSLAIPSDRYIASYVNLQRQLSRTLDFIYSKTDSPSGLQTSCDYLLIIRTFEAEIMAALAYSENNEYPNESPTMRKYKQVMGQFYSNYVLLVINSFGLQNALERQRVDIGHFFARCHTCAYKCAMLVRDYMGPSGYLKYSPDSHFVQMSYAVLTLLKLLRPEFTVYLENEHQTISLVNDVADVLESISVNPTHTPALYAAFLKALISAKTEPSSSSAEAGASTGTGIDGHGHAQGSGNITADDTVFISGAGAHAQGHFGSEIKESGGMFPAEFSFEGEMGPVVDMSTFPPTMGPNPVEDNSSGLPMDSILSSDFWDSVLVPGFNSMDGLSGGFVFGAGGSGLITPRFGATPLHSGQNTPMKGAALMPNELAQINLSAVFDQHQGKETSLEN